MPTRRRVTPHPRRAVLQARQRARRSTTIAEAAPPVIKSASRKRVRIPKALYDPARVQIALDHAELLHAAWPLVPLIYGSAPRTSQQHRRFASIILKTYLSDLAKYNLMRSRAQTLAAHHRDAFAIFELVARRMPADRRQKALTRKA